MVQMCQVVKVYLLGILSLEATKKVAKLQNKPGKKILDTRKRIQRGEKRKKFPS
jgi:hypothetical protein